VTPPAERPLAGRVALITGGSRGVGAAIALRLARDGAAVAVNYRRDADAAKAVVATIEAAGGRAVAFRASIDIREDVEELAPAVLAELGAVDILVCNAGIASRGKSVVDTDPAELEQVLRTHALGHHRLCSLLIPPMRARPRGDIVMISSVASKHQAAMGAPYNMAKSALESLALTLAKEEQGHGIRVNIVAPGLVVTEMGRRLMKAFGVDEISTLDPGSPFGRVCTPEDVAGVVAFLVSENGSYVSGQRIEVDGGGQQFPIDRK